MDVNVFRDAMAQFGSGVTIPVTVDASGRPWGFTASAFCSVSLEPPLVLVCLARSADSYPAFRDARRYAIHVLRADQAALARRFAEKRADKFEEACWQSAEDGLPALREALARIDCAAHAVHDGGDHAILVGRVVHVDIDGADAAPLLHFRRRFVHSDAACGSSLPRSTPESAPMSKSMPESAPIAVRPGSRYGLFPA
jgi:flavin reductase ActVB